MAHETKKTPYNVLRNRPMVAGAVHTKDATNDDQTREAGLEALTKEVGEATTLMAKFASEYKETAKIVTQLQKDAEARGGADDELKAKIEESANAMADALAKAQACETALDTFKAEMDAPIYRNAGDLKDADMKAAIELQRQRHKHAGGEDTDFVEDLDNLVEAKHYRSAMQKLVRHAGVKSRAEVVRTFSEDERKAFEAASLDSAFFMPEMLGIEVDCEIECASMLDLYQQVSVNRSSFMFPHVESYGDIGTYDCDAKCDAEYGPEGNITWKNGMAYDYRGAFCFQRHVLNEANYDLLGFMFRAAQRSHRINRNEVQITGDGVNQPLGWLTADCFTKVAAPNANPTHQDLRQFLASAPVEYGDTTAVMHQNVFAYFASMVDNNGRFIFGDNLMGFSPSDVVDRIRISNCLPDPTEGQTLGSTAAPFASGSFIMAAGVWEQAYASVTHTPMMMEQFIGGSSMWCVKYQFGAKDGGFVSCCPAARTFQAG